TRHTFSDLTPREYELADCIMRGLHRAEISREMGIKPDTISKYRKSIYSKLGISKQHELFALAEQLERNPADK
ncbi:MAG TPA: helix-turn-helix transcriptional regulator, partial [Ruminococcaceae bacterium]|nr:helix-turn-helix transcriptional regulator [Oscillospiraceae bacterium]